MEEKQRKMEQELEFTKKIKHRLNVVTIISSLVPLVLTYANFN